MPPQGEGLARQWFIPGEGIDRHVISTDIQRYLGNDATVRPGRGTGDNQGVEGYWIKAYRNLTSAMIQDLRADSKKWRAEQQATGSRAPYDRSATYQQSNATVAATQIRDQGRGRDSPSSMDDGQYVAGRNNPSWNAGAMDIDPPGPPSGFVGQPGRGGYPTDSRYGPQPDRRQAYATDHSMMDSGYRPPTTGAYPSEQPRYAPGFSQPNNAPGAYYPDNSYMPPTSGYVQPGAAAPQFPPGQYPPGQYGQQGPPGRDRDRERDPRGGPGAPGNARGAGAPGYGQPDYQDPNRYDINAYPSPATTVSTLASNPREHIASPPGISQYGPGPNQYDQYGGRTAQPPYGAPEQYPPQPVDPPYRQERRQPVPQPQPDKHRRRHH